MSKPVILSANVYRNANGIDCSNEGCSICFDRFRVVFSEQHVVENDDYQTLWVHEEHGILKAFPFPRSERQNYPHHMFGGNFVYTSDSRWPSGAPIKIFDRIE